MNHPARPRVAAPRTSEVASGAQRAGARPQQQAAQLLSVLWRGRFSVLVIMALALALGWLQVKSVTPVFTARAVVALETRQQNIIDIEAVAAGFSGDFFDINTQVQVLMSRNLMSKVVEELDLAGMAEFNPFLRPEPEWRGWRGWSDLMAALGRAPEPRGRPDAATEHRNAVDILLRKVSISQVPRSLAFTITVVAEDPELAARIANAIAARYIVDQLDAKFEATRLATEWLSERVGELKVNLEIAEAGVESFIAASSLVSEEALALQNRQLKESRDRVDQARAEAAGLAGRAASAAEALEAGDLAGAAERLGSQEAARLAESLDTYDEASRPPQEARVRALLESLIERLRGEADRAERQAVSLAQSVLQQEAIVAEQSAALVELRQLQREAEASRTLYEFFLARMKETAAQEGIQQADARILSPAVRPYARSAPRATLIYAVALMLGFLAGAAWVLIRERLNTSFRSARDLETQTGIGVMGTVPAAPFRRRQSLLDYLVKKPTSGLSEALRNLRTSILLSNIDHPPQVTMITSSVPGEGKTTTSIGLAVTSAMMGKRVLLLECDFRRRVLARYFEIGDRPGIISVLAGTAQVQDAVYHHKETGVDVMVGERSPVNAVDIFTSERFGKFLDAMRQHYDFIFLDTPPVLAVPDARMIAKRVDAMVFAVRWSSTTRAMVEDALALFQQVDLPVSGLALTQVNARQMARYAYGGYGGYRGVAKYYTS